MATRYAGVTHTAGPKVRGSDVIFAASGGTLGGSQHMQVVWDDTYYPATQEGKQRLLADLEVVMDRIETAKVWPATSSS